MSQNKVQGAGFEPVKQNVNFPHLEEEILKYWQEKNIVKKYLQKNNNSKERFSFLDGPITANNPMAVHHAWGRTYKDLWQRFWNMRGRRQRFQNGFDEQGLWVEVEVEKELGLKNKKDIENLIPGDKFKSLEKFINLCKERVKKFSGIQTEQSKRLGYFMDWDNSYHTSSDENNYAIWNFLKVVNEKGWLYKGRDSVPWCPRCGTAISQHEILTEEYKNVTHDAVYIEYPILGRKNEYLIAWTTTPWTLVANVALTVHPSYDYAVATGNEEGNIYYLLKENAEKLKLKIKKIIKGKDLVGLNYSSPFDNLPKVKEQLEKYIHKVIATDELILPISKIEGTGIVHTAPGAGSEDFKLGKQNGLPVIEVIGEEGNYLAGFGGFSGKDAKKHPELIIDFIKSFEKGKYFFLTERYTHRYPTCWRCKTELVWRVVDEWYIAMDTPSKSKIKNQKSKIGETFREQMVKVAKKINWIPDWGLDRELDWLKNMHDWLISKKRYWGLALPIWECEKCKSYQVIGSKEELEKNAVQGWEKLSGNSPHRPWIDEVKVKCEKCGEIISRIPDVGNPWLDAGIVPFSTMPEEWFPADFITESFPGQFKNWFYSLIAMTTVLENSNSFKTVLGFASVRDEKGEEMHKSKGNAIEFNQAADEIGVDVMRWMYVKQDPEQNLNFGIKAADNVRRQFHLMLWNVYNFFVSNANIDHWSRQVKVGQSENVLDKWIVSGLNKLIKTVTLSLEKYDAFSASNSIESFVNDLSLWYVRRSRGRIGLSQENTKDKNNCYETLWEVLASLCQILAPFTPFIAEEIYLNLTGEESVHLANWPEVGDIDEKLEQDMDFVRKLCELGHAKRKEIMIKVRQPLAELKILNSELQIQDEELISLIKDELNVKKVSFEKGKGEMSVFLDVNLTTELKEEGEARNIVRMIQQERKKLGTELDERVNVVLKDWPKKFEEEIKKKAMVNNL
ncbi:MAG: Isoleucyl-tRNA synthetase, partial [Candidatus Levybacteria bacterium GW2011_GWB1_37_8]